MTTPPTPKTLPTEKQKTERAMAALDTMATTWAMSFNLREGVKAMMALPDGEDRLVAFIKHCYGEGLYEGRTSLAAQPPAVAAPEEMSPDFTDTARAALLSVLWHHQGASSPVGQPIRFALGMGAFDELNDHQISEAKRWESISLAPQPTAGQQDRGEALIERIAKHWDGCMFDSPGEGDVDIGAAIRQNAKCFAGEATAAQGAATERPAFHAARPMVPAERTTLTIDYSDAAPIEAQVATGNAETYLRGRYGAYRGHFAWRELEEAFNAGAAGADWLPIETAPDGKLGYSWMLLAWGPEEDRAISHGMRWGDKFFATGTFHCLGQDKRFEFREIEVKPTHWMRLPAAPGNGEGGK